MPILRKICFAFVLALGTVSLKAQLPQDVHHDFMARRTELVRAGVDVQHIETGVDGQTREALEFLYAYMPWPDVADYSPAYHEAQVRMALRARREMPWGASVPRREWLHFVVPVRVNNEALDTFRTARYDELRRRVAGMSMREAVLEVNHWCHEYVTYKPADARTSSPLNTMRTATGRCGEESTFTVAALRAIGIPARQVYTPRWAHTDDNHAWVEAWVDGAWHFLGACEPEAVLDLGWFNAPASRGMLMHTKVYGRYDGPEDVISRTACYTEINVTANYAPVARQTVEVVDEKGRPVAGADLTFRLYNYAELYPVSRTLTDGRGRAAITAGLGDLVAWAAKDGRYGLAQLHVGRDSVTRVVLNHRAGDAFSLDMTLTPPAGRNNLPTVSPDAAAANERRKVREDSIRGAYVAGFPDSAAVARFCAAKGLDFARVRPLVVKSCGNYAALMGFLGRHCGTDAPLAYSLLATLTDKDLRDFDAAVLDDHFRACRAAGLKEIPADLGVRLSTEKLTPWRSYFRRVVPVGLRVVYRKSPARLAAFVCDSIETDDVWNPQAYCLSPERAYALRRADTHSKGLLFVAMARALGIPARIDEVTGKVQWRTDATADAAWQTVDISRTTRRGHTAAGTLALSFTPHRHMANPAYYRHFTLSRLTAGQPVLQEYDESATWQQPFAGGVAVDAADYLLISGTRNADGSVLAHFAVVPVRGGMKVTTPLIMREDSSALHVIGQFNAENRFTDASGQTRSVLAHTGRGYFVVGLLRANHEPSNHILHDLEQLRTELEAWGRPILLLFPSRDELDRFNRGRAEFANLPANVSFGVDTDGQARHDVFDSGMAREGNYPVIVLADTFNRVVFMTEGYTIGIGEQLKQALRKL